MTGEAADADLLVKVGGSLARVDAAIPVLEVLASGAAGRRVLVVSGGGAEADRVREAYRRGELELVEAHWEAIRSLDRMGAKLAARYEARRGTDALRLCASSEDCISAWSEGQLPVLVPFPFFDRWDPLPHRWDVTSDSVAGWLAEHFGAGELVLVKARDPRGGDAPPGEVAGAVGAAAAAEEDLVDAYFPTVLARPGFGARCWIVNGQRPERLAAWLETGSTAGLWRVTAPSRAGELGG